MIDFSVHQLILTNLFSSELLCDYLPRNNFSSATSLRTTKHKKATEQLSSFKQSLQNDYEAASSIVTNLNLEDVSQFIDALENCTGQFLISGVGKCIFILYTMHVLQAW